MNSLLCLLDSGIEQLGPDQKPSGIRTLAIGLLLKQGRVHARWREFHAEGFWSGSKLMMIPYDIYKEK